MTEEKPSRGTAPWSKSDWLLVGAFFAVTFLSRVPFRTTMLYAWDSVLYTKALDLFNVTIHQPQPPGHIYYVGLIWLVNRLLDDPNAAMVWISVAFSAAATASLYWVGRTMFGRAVGATAAALLATSLSFWAYSEVAYPYTLLGFLGITAAGLIYRTWEGKTAYVLPAALFLAAATGFRQDLLPFLLPLLLVGLVGKGRLRAVGALLVLAAGVAAWYVPSALLSGGFSVYREASSQQSRYLMDYFSIFGRGFGALGANLTSLGRFTLLGMAAATPLVLLFLAGLPTWFKSFLRDRRFWFLATWTAPSLLFYIFIHVGEYGYVFTFLPAALLAAAWGLESFTRRRAAHRAAGPQRGRSAASVFAAASAVLVAANMLLFLAVPTPLSAGRLAARDVILRSRLETIRGNFDPGSTFIVSVFDYQQATWYLPGYTHWRFDPAVVENPSTVLPPETKKVVIFEEYLLPADSGNSLSLPVYEDVRVYYLSPADGSTLSVDWETRKVILDSGRNP